jgi:hypothetical protein
MKNKLNKQSRSETVLQFFYPTSDNWAGNFDRNTVSVSLYAWEYFITRIIFFIEKMVRLHCGLMEIKLGI